MACAPGAGTTSTSRTCWSTAGAASAARDAREVRRFGAFLVSTYLLIYITLTRASDATAFIGYLGAWGAVKVASTTSRCAFERDGARRLRERPMNDSAGS